MITQLSALDARAGTRRFPKDTTLMHNFTLLDAQGREIRNTNHEAHEQFLVRRFLQPDDTVLELGGGLGANSIQMNKRLDPAARRRHVVVEPQAELVKTIRENARRNGAEFRVVHGALTKSTQPFRVPTFSPDRKRWLAVRAQGGGQGGVVVPSLRRLPNAPTAIVADCEGCLLQVLTDFPEALARIRMVYMENDGGPSALRGVQAILRDHGMRLVVNTGQHKLFVKGGSASRKRGSRRRSRRSRR